MSLYIIEYRFQYISKIEVGHTDIRLLEICNYDSVINVI